MFTEECQAARLKDYTQFDGCIIPNGAGSSEAKF